MANRKKKCQTRFFKFTFSLGSLTQSTLSLLTALPPLHGPDTLGQCLGLADSWPGGRGPLPEGLRLPAAQLRLVHMEGYSVLRIQQNPKLLHDRYRVYRFH